MYLDKSWYSIKLKKNPNRIYLVLLI